MSRESAVRIAVLLPELLGTYGDGGNGRILERRLAWRGIAVERIDCTGGTPIPEQADVYLLGGGEDRPQTLAARELRSSGAVNRAHVRGAVVFAVCAGFQIIGQSFPGAEGVEPGLSLIDITTEVGPGPRCVGELAFEADPILGLPTLSGFENHQGVTRLGPGVEPLGRVVTGRGNGIHGVPIEGARAGRVVATYAHGPVLARNPALADHLLSMVLGELAPLPLPEVDALRAERLRAVNKRTTK